MYRVIKYFTDLQDHDHAYSVGDVFPREGHEVTAARLAELAGKNNKQGQPLIQLVEEPKEEVVAEPKKKKATKKASSK